MENGFIFSISALLLQNIIIIPAILMLNVSALNLYRVLIGKEKRTSIKQELIRHTSMCIFLIFPIIIAALIGGFISNNLVISYIKSNSF